MRPADKGIIVVRDGVHEAHGSDATLGFVSEATLAAAEVACDGEAGGDDDGDGTCGAL